MSTQPQISEAGRISQMLGLYKAEWLNGNLFELFSEPQYFGELKTSRPCVLIGGRGTGKTTVLKGLSYKGQFALHDNKASSLLDAKFYGIYYRVNTNRVTAFKGEELSEDRWTRYFAHYLNLVFCTQLLEFVEWFSVQTGSAVVISPRLVEKVGLTFGLQETKTLSELNEAIESLLLRFEASINALNDEMVGGLSLQGAPVDELTNALCGSELFRGKQFYFLIDEFENFENYQQRVVNTLIKHATQSYTFKVGVRELGWRERATLNANEQLTSPADYAHVNIGDVLVGAKFKNFASDVVLSRLAPGLNRADGRQFLRTLLPKLSEMQEAHSLLESTDATRLMKEARNVLDADEYDRICELPIGKISFAKYWSDVYRDESFADSLRGLSHGSPKWTQRVNNHFYSFLFTIRKRKPGLRKYYCGWDVYVRLANGNIRYLLELVHAAFLMHLDESDQVGPITPKTQTLAAQAVGKKNLDELQGLSVDGAHLTKLLLSLGRIFQLFAEEPSGHTPEANEFHIQGVESAKEDASAIRLLNSAVMHLALVRRTANKLADARDTKEYDYSVHPIFAPFFVFSYRRKRKLALTTTQLLGLVSQPRSAIEDVMKQNNREPVADVLPDQMGLFEAFYE